MQWSSAQDDIAYYVHADEGITGIGEGDTNPRVAQAMIRARGTHVLGLEEMLLGEGPPQPEALWDIKGKELGLPCWKLPGGAGKPHITPYASLLPTGRLAAEYRDSLAAKPWARISS